MNRSRPAMWIPFVLITVSANLACERPSLTMRYDGDWDRVVPVLKPGSEIVWEGGISPADIRWSGNDSPCDPNHTDRCVIKDGIEGRFKYKCKDPNPCDPEIVVDDGVGVTITTTREMTQISSIAIDAFCPGGQLDVDPPERAPRSGETVGWRASGSNPPDPWTVTFDDQTAACENSGPITSPGGSCTVRTGEHRYTFTSTKADCAQSVQRILIVQ